MAVMNLGGLGGLNTQINDAEKLYFNLPEYIKTYMSGRTVASEGANAAREVKSTSRGANVGAQAYTEGRINALRQQRAGLNVGTDAEIPYKAFDPKNLSNDNNVYESPENIAARNGFGPDSGAPGGNQYLYNSQDLQAGMRLVNGRMVYGLWTPDGVNVMNQQNSVGNAVDQQAQSVASEAEKSEMEAYKASPEFLKNRQTGLAKAAGTYSDTAEFGRGMTSELALQQEGVDKVALDRVNALRASRGMPPLLTLEENPQTALGSGPTAPSSSSPTVDPSTYSSDMNATISAWNAQTAANGGVVQPVTPPSQYVQPNANHVASQTINTAPKPLVASEPATTASNSTGSAGTSEAQPATGEATPASTEGAPTAVQNDSNDLTSGKALNDRLKRTRALKMRSL
jgi:hypothetical protein